ncbi:hypothetical protein ANRL3_02844 [Anaerolineae bacterium]|nr:hypothetical protein ANRL3_02844 [Anaerolineae bacterium]
MTWRGVPYVQHIFLGSIRPKPIYSAEIWTPLSEKIGPAFHTSRGTPSLRVLQFDRTARKEVEFGKLIWKADSFEKWTHGSRLTKAKCSQWDFSGMEVWSPSAAQCAKDDSSPDAYLSIWTDPYATAPHLNGLAVALLAKRVDTGLDPLSLEQVSMIASSMNARIVGRRTSNWVWRFFEGGMPVHLNDYLSMCLPLTRWAESGVSLEAIDRREAWERIELPK